MSRRNRRARRPVQLPRCIRCLRSLPATDHTSLLCSRCQGNPPPEVIQRPATRVQ